jgi:predicted enzyme related to lactoylglutathione lyase
MTEKNKSIKDFIVGVGGIFFKSKNPDNLRKWYKDTLGFQSPSGSDEDPTITFNWKSFDGENHSTVWGPFAQDSDYFSPSSKDFMINYIVNDLEKLLIILTKQGIQQIGDILIEEYGKFAWILDPEGNKIEFWEPNKEFFKDKY